MTKFVTLLMKQIILDDSALRDAMYINLSDYWSRYSGAAVRRSLHLSLRSDNVCLSMGTRLGRSLLQ